MGSDTNQQNGAGLFGAAIRDSVIVVLSILLAFWIDAWWEGRSIAARELELLVTLAGELDAAAVDIAEFQGHHELVAASATRLIALAEQEQGSAEEADSLLGVIINGRRYRPSDVSLGSVLGGDGLATLSDPVLRRRLGAWRQMTANLVSVSEVVSDQLNTDLNTYINMRVPYRTLDRAAGTVSGLDPSRFPTNILALFGDVEFENHVYNRSYLASIAASESTALLAATKDLAEEVRRHLAK